MLRGAGAPFSILPPRLLSAQSSFRTLKKKKKKLGKEPVLRWIHTQTRSRDWEKRARARIIVET